MFYPQKMKLFEAVLSEVKGEVPVIANVGDNCTADTVDYMCIRYSFLINVDCSM